MQNSTDTCKQAHSPCSGKQMHKLTKIHNTHQMTKHDNLTNTSTKIVFTVTNNNPQLVKDYKNNNHVLLSLW